MFNKTIITTALILTATVTIICYVNLAESQEYVIDGLIGFWTMDEEDIQGKTVKDVSGNGNDGKIEGDPNPTNPSEGKIEEALEFDGVDDYIDLPDMGLEPKVTAEIWAKGTKPWNFYNGLVAAHQWVAGCVHFKVENDGGLYKVMVIMSGQARVWGPEEAETGQWYHYAYTSDTEEDEMKLYVDGELVQEGQAGGIPNDLTDHRIGDEYTDLRPFPGILDEVRIYNRILTEEEIEQNYKVKSNELAVNPTGKLSICWGKIKASR